MDRETSGQANRLKEIIAIRERHAGNGPRVGTAFVCRASPGAGYRRE